MRGKWTPGPWIIIPARPYDGDDPALEGSFDACAGIEGSDGSPVCVFGDASGSATMFENEHDHRLIAAAPALYEALQALREATERATRHSARDGERGCDVCAALLAAERALAQARGEQP